MPGRKKLSPEEALGRFVNRLETVEHRPNINHWEPMPQQEIFLMSQSPNRILFGGNRAGKTAAGTADDVLVLLRKHPYRQHLYPNRPLRLRVMGADFQRGVDQTLVPYFAQYIPPSKLINGSWEDSYRRSDRFLTLADESTVSFMSYEQDPASFQSVALDHIHFDEEPPEPIYRESMVRLLDSNGTWTMTETPVQQLEWVDDELIQPWKAGQLPKLDVITIRTTDNIHLQGSVEELASEMKSDEKMIRLEGQYPPGKSKVFPEFTGVWPFIIPHTLFLERFRQDPSDWNIWESMDYGYVNPTAWIWTATHKDGSIVTFHVRYAPRVVISEWARIVKLTRKSLALQLGLTDDQFMSKLRATFGDPAISRGANGDSGLTVQQSYGLNGVSIGTEGLYESRTGNANVGLDHMHKYLKLRPPQAGIPESTGRPEAQPWWQITDAGEEWVADNADLIGEMRKARTPKQTLTQQTVKNPAEQIRDKDNHAIDGQKYLFMATFELRPREFATEGADFQQAFASQFGRPTPAASVHDDIDANLGAASTTWDTYSSLEY